jgi:peptidyl-tRNA hydrolase, PTH1 family
MKLIVGLGNIGDEYNFTRHNVGFMFVDKLAEKYGIEFNKQKCKAFIGEGKIGNEKVILAKPTTYMNLSGESVQALVNFWKIDLKDIIIVYDDIDLPKGKIRFREVGSAGTHNGMRNIVSMLNSENIPRLRIGTDKPNNNENLADYVLGKLKGEELDTISSAINEGIVLIETKINNV